MINIHTYFEINWEATAANIRWLMTGTISKETLAKSMCVTTRTVANWCRGKAHPSMDTLILLARFFNVDVLDIVVTNGQLERPIEWEDYQRACELAPENANNNERSEKLNKEGESYDVRCEKDFVSTVLFNEYLRNGYPIRTIEEFLLYLPLFNFEDMADVIWRLQGNLDGSNEHYFFTPLDHLYRHINNTEAKEYVEAMVAGRLQRHFAISNSRTEPRNLEENEEMIHNYETALSQFIRKLKLVSNLRHLIDGIDHGELDFKYW